MASKNTRSIAGRLEQAGTLLSNSLDDAEILALVGPYGYDTTRLHEGLALHTEATAAVSAQAAAAGAQRAATLRAIAAEAQARANYAALVRVARALFSPGSAERKALGLQGIAPENNQAFNAAAMKLYDNALSVEDVRDALAEYGYPATRLTAERTTIQALILARRAQVAATAAATEATAAQNVALETLARWVSRYRAIVTTALQHNMHLRERLGLPPRSGAAARRPAPAPAP